MTAAIATGRTLTHDGVWADDEQATRDGWTMILASLATRMEPDHG